MVKKKQPKLHPNPTFDKSKMPSRHTTVGPEVQVGGPIGLLKNGDLITIDAVKGRLTVDLTEKELKKRRKAWKPRNSGYIAGAPWKYAELVGPAVDGAVTHPGAKKESHTFADI